MSSVLRCVHARCRPLVVMLALAPLAATSATAQTLLFTLDSRTPSATGHFGTAVSAAGDADGDGVHDILAGAPDEDYVGGNPDVGNAHLFSGATGLFTRTLLASPANQGTQFGYAVRIIPDYDGDGRADLAVGAPFQSNVNVNTGRLHLFTATSARREGSPTAASSGLYAIAIASANDATGDGIPDLLVGAANEGQTGRVHIINAASGAAVGYLDAPDAQFQTTFGTVLTSADLNGDGVLDWIVGGPFIDLSPGINVGRVYAFDGATAAPMWTTNTPRPQHMGSFGTDIAPVGDLNGDGGTDLVVSSLEGRLELPERAGRVYILDGRTGQILRTRTSPRAVEEGWFGFAVAGVGDANGDGHPDYLVGAPQETVNGLTLAGRAYVFSGLDDALIFEMVSPNPAASGRFGWAVDAAGDLNGDLANDWAIGAPYEPFGGHAEAGRVYVFAGADVIPPTLSVGAAPVSLWPANSSYATFNLAGLGISASDLGDVGLSAADVVITSVTSDEPEDMPGSRDGSTTRDMTITFDCRSTSVRAERDSKHNGRVYTINLAVADAAGNVATATYRVAAPIRRDGAAVRDLDAFTVAGCDPVTGAPAAAPVAASSEAGSPASFALEANAPNPFSSLTRIGFSVGEAAHVRITLFDLTGREVARLVDRPMEPGTHHAGFDAGPLPAGTYLYRMEAGTFRATRRLTIAR